MEGNGDRRIRALEENPSRMEGELHSMRREMDELRRILREKDMDNLDVTI